MRRRIAGLALLTTLVAAAPAVASRAPTAKEQRAITAAVRAKLTQDGSPAAKNAVIDGIRISSRNAHWATADLSAPEADDAVVALQKRNGRWRVRALGTAEVQCGIGMPTAVMRELFKDTGGANCPG